MKPQLEQEYSHLWPIFLPLILSSQGHYLPTKILKPIDMLEVALSTKHNTKTTSNVGGAGASI